MREALGLEGEPALVVGGGFGIGRSTAILLAKAGAKVAVADIVPERARAVADEVGGYAIVGDVTKADGARAVVDEAHAKLGGLRRVANIVGLMRPGLFLDTDLAHWREQIEFNLVNQMMVCHAAGPYLIESGGAIAMVASVSGIYGARNQVGYGIAKAGVLSLTRTLADEWGRYNVRVNAVAPDVTATPRLVANIPGAPDEARAMLDSRAVVEGVPLERFGSPEEIAGPILFLLSNLSSFMTGQCLVLDGGTMVHFPHNVGGSSTR